MCSIMSEQWQKEQFKGMEDVLTFKFLRFTVSEFVIIECILLASWRLNHYCVETFYMFPRLWC